MLQFVATTPRSSRPSTQHLAGLDRRDPARLLQIEEQAARSSSASRCCDRRPDADRRRPRRRQHPRADKLMTTRALRTFLLWLLAELFENLPKSATARSRSCVLLRRGALSSARRRPRSSRSRAGGAADPLEGRGRVLRDAEPHRHPRRCWGSSATASSALRAFTPRPEGGQSSPRRCARTRNRHHQGILELAREALVSMLDAKGSPASRTRVMFAPGSQIGRYDTERRRSSSPRRGGHYEKALDRESAFEMLKARAGEAWHARTAGKEAAASRKPVRWRWRHLGRPLRRAVRSTGPGRKTRGVVDALAKSAARSVGSSIGRSITRACWGRCSGQALAFRSLRILAADRGLAP